MHSNNFLLVFEIGNPLLICHSLCVAILIVFSIHFFTHRKAKEGREVEVRITIERNIKLFSITKIIINTLACEQHSQISHTSSLRAEDLGQNSFCIEKRFLQQKS